MRPWLDGRESPDGVALEWRGRRISRAELAADADALAAWLDSARVRAGDVVAALLPNGPEYAALLHAVDRLDALLLPLNLRLSPPEIAYMLRDAGARLVLHGGEALATLASTAAEQADGAVARELPRNTPPARPAPPTTRDLDAAFALLYTSGTSGRPKGALLTHRNLLASAEASARHLELRGDDRWLACLPLYHVGGLSILLRCALGGIPARLHERFDAVELSRALDDERITFVSLVPTMLQRLLDARGERPAPPWLRCVLLGGGPLPAPLLERAARLGFPLAPSYGLTEAASQVATLRPGEAANPAGAGLQPLPGTELRIVDPRGRALPIGEPGEIQVRSATVMRGYWKLPDETRRALAGGWLHTGDVGALDAHGRLTVLDRCSDLIASGGENVYPAEIEAVLLEHPDVLEAAVAGVPDAEFGERPAAWIVARPGSDPTHESLARFCRTRLAGYKVPVRVERIGTLPRNASGKLLRRQLVTTDHAAR
jgi:O-succinylbenzoic acid--CoA ligase